MTQDAVASDRAEARRVFGYRYYQGAPCKRGHPGIRYVGNSACLDCTRVSDALRRALADEDQREAERRRRREGKRSGRWARQDPAIRRLQDRASKERVRNRPENVMKREIAALERELERLDREAEKQAQIESRAAERSAKAVEFETRRIYRNRMKASRRRALKRGYGISEDGSVATAEQAQRLLESQGHRCAYCGEQGELHLDHRYPASLGGTHELVNLQFLCARHNMHKRTTPDLEYRAAHEIPILTPWDGIVWRSLLAA